MWENLSLTSNTLSHDSVQLSFSTGLRRFSGTSEEGKVGGGFRLALASISQVWGGKGEGGGWLGGCSSVVERGGGEDGSGGNYLRVNWQFIPLSRSNFLPTEKEQDSFVTEHQRVLKLWLERPVILTEMYDYGLSMRQGAGQKVLHPGQLLRVVGYRRCRDDVSLLNGAVLVRPFEEEPGSEVGEPIPLFATAVGVRISDMFCGQVRQFPIIPASAVPLLSLQGFTMSPAITLVVDIVRLRSIFKMNHLYVLLSRVKDFGDICWECGGVEVQNGKSLVRN